MDVPAPAEDQIVDHPLDWEAAEIAAAFRGQHWKTIPPEVLAQYYNSLSFFTPEAYRYFLPAYLLAAMQRHDRSQPVPETGYGIEFSVVWSLTRPKHKGPELDRFLTRMEPFRPEQKAVIREFLHWIVARETKNRQQRSTATAPLSDAEIALNRYWETAEKRRTAASLPSARIYP